MALSFLGLLKDQVSDDLIGKLAGFLEESPSNTKSALGSALPSLLTGLVQVTSSRRGSQTILDMLAQSNGKSFANLEAVLDGENPSDSLTIRGNAIIDVILGNRLGDVVELIASTSGINRSSTASLLNIIAPVVMDFIGGQVTHQRMRNAEAFSGLMAGQSGFLKESLPAGLSALLEKANRKRRNVPFDVSLKRFIPLLSAALLLAREKQIL